MSTDDGGGYVCFCGNPIPILGNVVWCNSCIDEFLAQIDPVTMDTFIAQKKEARRQREQQTPPDGLPVLKEE
jgi:hypothetical protein